MALVVPIKFSTFGDSSTSEGPLRKYVLAQFRSDADLDWVGELRAKLATDELKYKLLRERRATLKKKEPLLWSRVERGVGQASVVVIDPAPVEGTVRQYWEATGAEEGVDYDESRVKQDCAAALVRNTPVAHLPEQLATVVDWPLQENLERFTPEEIQQEIGDGLRSAQVFAARAHATFDVVALDETARATHDAFRSPLAPVILNELLSTRRIFDTEHSPSMDVLNRASEAIADGLQRTFEKNNFVTEPLVREYDSRAVDELQAADVAAGWGREAVDTVGVRALGTMFERVWVNGMLMKGTHD